jgi:hypothetical protein
MEGDAKHSSDARTTSRAQRLAAELRANLGKRRAQAKARKTGYESEAGAPSPQSTVGHPHTSGRTED